MYETLLAAITFIELCIHVLLQGCMLSDHPVGKSAIGKSCSSAEMERLIDQLGPVQLETINSAEWTGQSH